MFPFSTFLRVVTSIALVVGLFCGSSVGFAETPSPKLSNSQILQQRIDQIDNAQLRTDLSSTQYVNLSKERGKLVELREKAKTVESLPTDEVARINSLPSTELKRIESLPDGTLQKLKDQLNTVDENLKTYSTREDFDQLTKDKIKLEKEINEIVLIGNKSEIKAQIDKFSTSDTEIQKIDSKTTLLQQQLKEAKTPEEKQKIEANISYLEAQKECAQLSTACDQSKVTATQEAFAESSNIFTNSQQQQLALSSPLKLCTLGMCIGNVYQGKKDPIEYTASKIIRFAARVIAPLAVLAIIIGGMMMIMSVGSEDMVNKGKSIVLYSVIALLGVFSAWVIVTLIQQVLYSLGV